MNTEARSTGPLSGNKGNKRHTTGSFRSSAGSAPTSPSDPSAKEPLVERTSDGARTAPGASHKLSAADFNTAMVHLYRGEVSRANAWRNRLDTTTNWAVLTAGATLSFVFSAPANPHFVIPINSLLVAFFLFMEARRYRYYEIWSSRVRILETGYFVRVLSDADAASGADEDWAENLAGDLMKPHFTISVWEAAGRRLRRNYLWLLVLLAGSWLLKVNLHPTPAQNLDEFVARASIGAVPGEAVILAGIVFNIGFTILAIATVRLREATGEVLPRHDFSLQQLRRVTDWTRDATNRRRITLRRATLRRAQRDRSRARRTTIATSTAAPISSDVSGEWRKSEDLTPEAEETISK